MNQTAAVRARSTWDHILSEVRKEVNPHSFDTWLRPTRQAQLDRGTLLVSIPHADFEHVARQKFGPQIEQAIGRLNLRDVVREIRYVPANGVTAAAPQTLMQPGAAARQPKLDFESIVNTLNPRYTFDGFVVGPSNQFANAAAKAVADRPGRSYNPLFIYGGVGMGKTHLMQAIGHQAQKSAPQLRIEYITAERFTNELITGIRTEQMISFRDRYRSKDILLIDDIQFIANKERTQEEFFHTFNALHGDQKQIVISSDRPPKELSQLEERLRSRFEWGLIADIQPPDLETKIAILMQKAQTEKRTHTATPDLPTEVAEFVASKIKSNIRELEGALVRLLAYCSLKGLPITVAIAQEALRNVIDQQQRKIDIETISKAVADMYGMRVADLKARNNSKHIVVPRQIAMFISKQLTEASLPEIARFFGGKHHSTAIHSIRKIDAERQTNKELERAINRLLEQLS